MLDEICGERQPLTSSGRGDAITRTLPSRVGLTLLCGRTEAPLTYNSSLMETSSPRTVMFSTRHWDVSYGPKVESFVW